MLSSFNIKKSIMKKSTLLWMGLALAFVSSTQAQHAKFKLFDGLIGGDKSEGESEEASEAPYSEDEKFVHPVTSPYGHEDSFVTTDARAWFAYQDFGSVIGGNAKLYALQLRIALTDQIQFVAYKDGYTDMDTFTNENGMNDIAAGIKYNFLQDWENQFHAAVGVGYEASLGDDEIFHDDDEVRLWGSVNKGFGKLHLGGTFNYYWVPEKNTNQGLGDSDHLSWHLHADYRVCKWFSPVLEMNGYHVIDEEGQVVPIQGVDLINIGGDRSDSVVTLGLGAEVRPIESIGIRAAYETPIMETDGLFNYRWTFSTVFSF